MIAGAAGELPERALGREEARLEPRARPVDHRVVARLLRLRPRLAEPRGARVDEARVERREVLPAELELLEGGGAEVRQEDVGGAGQPVEDRDAVEIFQVERDALLRAVVHEEAVRRRRGGQGGQLVHAPVVVALGRLHLDDLGAEVGEHRGRRGHEHHRGRLHHADPGEQALRHGRDGNRARGDSRPGTGWYTGLGEPRASVGGAAGARRGRRRRAGHRVAPHAASLPAEPHQPLAPRGRARRDRRGHRRRARRHAGALGTHLRGAAPRPADHARPGHTLPSGSHGQRGLAHRALAKRPLVHAGRVALRAVRAARRRRGGRRAARPALPAPRLRRGGAGTHGAAGEPVPDARADGRAGVPAHPGRRRARDRRAPLGGADRPGPRARARVPLVPRARRADLGRPGAPEDHDQRERVARGAPGQPAPPLPRLPRAFPRDAAGDARAPVARAPVPRSPRAARRAPRPPRRAARRGARRARRAAKRRRPRAHALPA